MRSLTFETPASKPKRVLAIAASALLLAGLAVPSAMAQRRDEPTKTTQQSKPNNNNPNVKWKAPAAHRTVVRPKIVTPRKIAVAPRRRAVGHINVYRPYGPTIYGYGFHYADAEAVRWIGFTAITLKVLDMMEEDQVRYYEQAQIEAATAPVGEAIVWNSGSASGSVTTLREGTDASGYNCREFQQTVTIGGQQETAFGTACLQADDTWRIVE